MKLLTEGCFNIARLRGVFRYFLKECKSFVSNDSLKPDDVPAARAAEHPFISHRWVLTFKPLLPGEEPPSLGDIREASPKLKARWINNAA